MTASYSEISFKSELSADSGEAQPSLDIDQIEHIEPFMMKEPVRPRPATLSYDHGLNSAKPLGQTTPFAASAGYCMWKHKEFVIFSGPLNLEGTVHVEGNITYFVAEDLEYKIKLSSPITKKEGKFI